MERTLTKIILSLLICLAGLRAHACDPVVNLGDTISFCQGNSITLNAFNPSCTYFWSTGATTATITVTTSGTYWVTVANNCGITRDTVVVIIDQPVAINLGPDQDVCQGSSYIMQAPYSPTSTYLWQDGSTNSFFQAIQSGKYVVEVTNSCGVFKDSINLSFVTLPNVQIGPRDTVLCNSNPITISAGNPGYPVQWSTGHSVNSFPVNVNGTYSVSSTNVCGTARDTITIHYSQPPDLGGTVGLCPGGTVTLNSNADFGTYLWSTGATTKTINVSTAGIYWVQFTDVCGTYSDTVQVVNSGPPNVNLGADTTICWGTDSIFLNAGFPGSSYLWYERDASLNFIQIATSQGIWVDSTGTFLVGVNNGCGFRYDTINVTAIRPPGKRIQDTVAFCPGGSITLDARYFGPGTTYAWDNGGTGQTSTYTTTGDHSVLITNQCGSYLNNFYIDHADFYSLNLGPDDTVCVDSVLLFSGVTLSTTDSVLWSDGSETHSISVRNSGTYWLTVVNDCGTFTDSITLTFLNPPGTISDDFITICAGTSQLVSVGFQPGTNYLWSTGSQTNTATINTAGTYWVRAWNACDTVSDTVVVYVDNPINVNLGPDIAICSPGPHILSVQGIAADSLRWSTGSRNAVQPVFTSGQYWVDMYNSCGVFSDTINITIKSSPFPKVSNTAYCAGSSVNLDATQPNNTTTYTWSNGATTPIITVSSPGWYWVDIVNDCGSIRDSAFVREDHPLPPINLGNDTIFCQGSLTLDPGYFAGADYMWSNGFAFQSITIVQSGTYYVTVSNTCNTVTDTIEVLITGPPRIVLGNEVRFCSGHTFTLDAMNPGCSYLWNTGDTTQTITVSTGGNYSVFIQNDCGSLTDSVNVIVEYPIEQPILGPDTIICQGDQLVLDPGLPGVERVWQNGSRNPTYTVFQTGHYWLSITNSCGTFWDSIYVEVQGVPVFSLGPDQAICHVDGDVTLYGPPGMVEYNWNTGDITQNAHFTQPGKYWLEVKNHCFSYTDTVELLPEYPINIDLGPDTVVCETTNYILDPGILNYDITWNDQSFQPTLQVNNTGWYTATAMNNCGIFTDSVYVQVDSIIAPIVVDSLICLEDTVTIDLSHYIYDIEWFDGSKERVRRFYEQGVYPIKIFNKCGVFDRDFEINVSNCKCPVHLANSFTPNGDGLNDSYKVVYDCDIKDYSMEIISRWGTTVFYSEDPTEEWDGTFNGTAMPIGVYTYKVYYKWNVYYLDRHESKFGTINLIR